MFDWISFLDEHGIEYVTKGNVSGSDVAIQCPFCGSADPSHHMGISTEGKGWKCWRESDHKGVSPVPLIAALLQCSYSRAANIAGVSSIRMSGNLYGDVRAMLGADSVFEEPATRCSLDLPSEYRTFSRSSVARPYVRYMMDRGYRSVSHCEKLSDKYGIGYCVRGPFKNRILFPVYMDKRLVNWTGRSINPSAEIRYSTLPQTKEAAKEQELPQAIKSLRECLLWYDLLVETDRDTIILCEGPFDALKINFLSDSNDLGVIATCFFTSGPTKHQVNLMYELLPKFDRKFLLLDRDSEGYLLWKYIYELGSLGLQPLRLPYGYDDPGELEYRGLVKILLEEGADLV